MFAIGNMKIGRRLGLVFGLGLLTLFALAKLGAMNATSAISFSHTMEQDNRETVALSTANVAIWALRWDVAQFVAVTDANERKQIVDNQEKQRKQFDDAIHIYQGGARTAEETAVIKELVEASGKYIDALPKWFELYGRGNLEAAAKFRAEQLTPTGNSTAKALDNLMALQQKSVEAREQDTVATMSQGRMLLVSLSGLALLATLVIAWLLVQSITRPLKQALDVAQRVAGGDLTNWIDENTAKDETGQLLDALKVMNKSLRKIVRKVRGGTDAIGTASEQIASGNADLSQRTEQQASSLQETASSMEELTSTVLHNSENAKHANHLAAGASEVAMKGGKVIGEVVDTMSSINESSKKIVDIISVIDGIAFQTNILALNAAVEAARAGEHGRGFAVVAMEVRTLAQRSAEAAKEIKQLIGDSVSKVENGTRLVDEAGKTMEQIVASVKQVTDIMKEIAAASQEQSSGIEEVNQAITQMDQVTQQNAALVEEASAAADSLKQQAQDLVQAVAVFKLAEEGTEPSVVLVREERDMARKARADTTHTPRHKVLGAGAPPSAHNISKERRRRMAHESGNTTAMPSSAAAEMPESDQWTEL